MICWLAVGGLVAGQACGQTADRVESDDMVVVYADGRQQPATLIGFDGSQPTVKLSGDALPEDALPGEGAAKTLRVGEWLRLGKSVATEPMPVWTPRSVWLVDGSRLAATQLSVEGETCRVVNDWCQLAIPLEYVRVMQWNGPLDARTWERLHLLQQTIEGADDAILMVDEDLRRGRIDAASWSAIGQARAGQVSGLWLQTGQRASDIATDRIRAVVPSPALWRQVAEAAGDVWVGTADGSRLRVREVDQERRWVLACGLVVPWKSPDEQADTLRMLAPCDTVPGLLAAQTPLRYRAVSVFGHSPPLRQWSVGVANGIQVAATSRLVFSLDGSQRLRGKIMVPAAGQGAVQAACRVTIQTADAKGAVTTRWQSEPLPAGAQDGVESFDVELSGERLLILGSDSVSGGDLAQPIWLDVVLSQGK